MTGISGESSVPLGRSGTGAAYVLGSKDPSALSILMQGDKVRALAQQRAQAAKLKADQESSKVFNDLVKFDQDGSPYFAESLNNEVYKPAMPALTGAFKNNRTDLFAQREAAAPILQRLANETAQSKAKTLYLNEKLRTFQGDNKLFDTDYAGQNLSAARRREDGTNRLPSEFDAEAWSDSLLGDEKLYKEPEVIRRATEKLMPIITQRIAEAGQLGGQHTSDQVRGRFVAFDGKGHAILNADGSPKLNLTADTQTLLESDPLFKLKVDAREKAYNAKREADPNMPQMSRRGHIAQMVGPLAFYDQTRDEQLNAQVRQPRATKADPKQLVATPTVSRQTSYYNEPGSTVERPNHYAAVGRSLGTAAGPGINVETNSGEISIVGGNGKVTRPNTPEANSRVPVQLLSRDYVLYANGKRLGRDKPYQTDEEAHQDLLNTIANSPHPEKLEVRVMGQGVIKDKARVAGDGLGGKQEPLGYKTTAKGRTPVYDTGTSETQHTVLVPITQEIDAQLRRASGLDSNNRPKYEPRATTAQERELIDAVTKRGGKLISPYGTEKPTAAPKPTTPAAARAARPAWLKPTKAAANLTQKKPTQPADPSGDML
jgi:hypothetical protein